MAGSASSSPSAVELLLDADGCALLLLQAVAHQMEFVLEIGVRLLEAGTVLEELHEPLFVRAHATRSAPTCRKLNLSINVPPRPREHGDTSGAPPAQKRCPRSAQYSSHLFNIMLRVQR